MQVDRFLLKAFHNQTKWLEQKKIEEIDAVCALRVWRRLRVTPPRRTRSIYHITFHTFQEISMQNPLDKQRIFFVAEFYEWFEEKMTTF